MKEKCLISFANKAREDYRKSQLRQIKSFVDTGWDGDYLLRCEDGYCDNYAGVDIKLGWLPITKWYGKSPSHYEVPYGFKCYQIQEAIEAGYRKILWCDSTIVKVGNLDPLFEHAAKHGVCAFENLGYPLKYWIHDAASSKLGITDEQLESMKQIMACVMVFDFDNPIGEEVFYKWFDAGRDGVSFNMRDYKSDREGWKGHQGDQPIISALLNLYNIPILPYGQLCYEPHDETKEYGEPLLVNKGIK